MNAGRHTGWRWLAVAAALLGLTAVALGAAGSHAIELPNAAAEQRWSVALQIHYFQAAALLGLAALSAAVSSRRFLSYVGWLQLLGTLLFSGSLYLRALHPEWIPGWLTPAGGMILLGSWFGLILILIRKLH